MPGAARLTIRWQQSYVAWSCGRYEHGALARGVGPAAPPRPLRRSLPDRHRHGQGPGPTTPPIHELFVLPARTRGPAAPPARAAAVGGPWVVNLLVQGGVRRIITTPPVISVCWCVRGVLRFAG